MSGKKKPARRRVPMQDRSRKIKLEIMAAAHDVMRERGVRALTTNAIAERAGIKVASIYDYFANKESVVAELYRTKVEQYRAFLETESEKVQAASWRSDIGTLTRNTWDYQLSIDIDRTLVDAAYYYEDLFEIARTHARLFAKIYSRLIRRLGATLPEDDLVDVCISIYTLTNATWSYWRLTDSQRQTAIERQIMLSVKLIETALEEA